MDKDNPKRGEQRPQQEQETIGTRPAEPQEEARPNLQQRDDGRGKDASRSGSDSGAG